MGEEEVREREKKKAVLYTLYYSYNFWNIFESIQEIAWAWTKYNV